MAKEKSLHYKAVSARVQRAVGMRIGAARRTARGQRTNQETLAAALEITRTSVSNIERGRHRLFLDQVFVMARELGVDVTSLLPPMSEVFPERSVRPAESAQRVSESDFEQLEKVVLAVTEHAGATRQARRVTPQKQG